MAVTALTLDPVVDVVINLSATSATRKKFNLALLMGDVGNNEDFSDAKIVTYTGLKDMLTAGFETTDRLYAAAALIFGQSKVPPKVAIGKLGTFAVAGAMAYTVATNAVATDTISCGGVTLTAVASGATGLQFNIGTTVAATAANIASVLAANATVNAKYTVTSVGATFTLTETTPGVGNTPVSATKTGTIVITSGTATTSATRSETPLETLIACRDADWEWYVGIYCATASDSDIEAMIAYAQSATPTTILAYTTQNATAYTAAGLPATLQMLEYIRGYGQYSTHHVDAIAASVGDALGRMTDTIDSAFTTAFKSEAGVATENSSAAFAESKVTALKGYNCNVYVNRGNAYNIFEDGRMSYGYWFDEMIFLDKQKNDIQMAVMDLLVAKPKIAQTEQGMTEIKNAIKVVLDDFVKINFVQPGVWNGNSILNLNNGDTLPGGYLIQSETVASQPQADRDARIAPNIYVSEKLAGAIQNVTINVDVNR